MDRPHVAEGRPQAFPIGRDATVEDLSGQPYELLDRLRTDEPVSWLPALSGWLVTRYDLAQQVLTDAGTFTVDDPRFSTAQVVGPSMLSLDGTEHARHRAPFATAFRPSGLRTRFTPFVQAETERLVDALSTRRQAELRRELAGPLAVAVVAHSLGLPDADAGTVLTWYDAIVGSVSAISAGEPGCPAGQQAFGELGESVAAATTTGGMLADAVAAGLTTAETVSNAAVLMFGGIETMEAMIANLFWHLLSDRGELAKVRDDPSLLPAAVEESLRLEPAAAALDRYATRDVELGGAHITRGDLVRVSVTAANRDPAVFAEPARFDLGRANSAKNLSFARGPHFCLAMDLARLETAVAVGTALGWLPNLRFAPGEPVRPTGLIFRKPLAVDAVWD